MTLFGHPDRVEPAWGGGPEQPGATALRRPPKWSVRNWPVRWKVLAIVLVPMALAVVFGGLRVSGALSDAGRLRLAADRATMVPTITDYMSALGGVLVAASSGGDVEGTKKVYEDRKYQLQSRLHDTDVASDVGSGVVSLVERGQGLLDQVLSNSIGLREEVTGYAPILLTAEDAISGSVRVDSERIRAEAEGLSRAVGARGQMMMQELLVNRGGELAEPELRISMITLAGTEPSTLFGMSEVLGVDSQAAKELQQQMVIRMAIMSDPDSVLPDNPVLRDSLHSTDQIASRVVKDTMAAVTASVQDRADERHAAALRDIALMLVAILLALAVVWLVARSLVRPLRTLRDGALRIAHTDLESEIARVRSGSAGSEREPAPLPVYSTEEVGQVAHAVDELHAQALLLAGDEARLRLLVNDMFETMSRRNRSLVDQQLSLIDRLERNEDDPGRLESLFRLDHLAARMRRNGANLLVLAGAQISHDKGRSAPLSTVISAATSEVEGYRRVETGMLPDVTVTGTAIGDTVHLLAELIDNALRYSPPTAPVRVSAESTDEDGVLVEIADSGLGMTDTDLRIANMRLAADAEVTPENARHMGLFVASRLAHRHGIQVRLAAAAPDAPGIIATVYLPPDLLVGGTGGGRPTAREGSAVVLPPAPAWTAGDNAGAPGAGSRNGSYADEPAASLLPRRNPGTSGITGMPAPPPSVIADQPHPQHREPSPRWEHDTRGDADLPATDARRPAPADTSAYFSARARAEAGEQPAEPAQSPPAAEPEAAPAHARTEDLIYQRMMSEWLVDPHELGRSSDLDWKSVWDHGWSLAADAENAPVASHTEGGLPVRDPGVRLVPGSVTASGPDAEDVAPPAEQEVRHGADPQHPVASNGVPRRPAHRAAERDPDAIRASIGSHFDGVRAGRSHARETRLEASVEANPETNPETSFETHKDPDRE